MIKLSVNVNKVATLRNSRGGSVPDVIEAVRVCVAAGAPGITVHPRADARHITPADVRAIAAELRGHGAHTAARERTGAGRIASATQGAGVRGGTPVEIEFNIEGDPRPDLLALVHEVHPDQCTLVPVVPGEVTSQAGWSRVNTPSDLPEIIKRLQDAGVRVSLFVEADPEPIAWAALLGADRVELYTEPFARAFERGPEEGRRSFDRFAEAARAAHGHGLAVNAGHDLDLANLRLFRTLPHLAEVSIGHALISRALFEGLFTVVREYLAMIDSAAS